MERCAGHPGRAMAPPPRALPRSLPRPSTPHVQRGDRRSVRAPSMSGSRDGTIDGLKSIIHDQGMGMAHSLWDANFADANFPTDGEGRTLHLGTRKGEVANRLLSVGSMDRALLLAGMLAPPRRGAPLFQHLSHRGFLTITGRYQGTPISIVTTLMGMPNMDFVVRESRAVVDGEMAVVRLGTCGALQAPARLGSFVVAARGAVCVRRDPDAWTLADGRPAYTVSAPVPADAQLTRLLLDALSARADTDQLGAVVEGANATADSFYSSQGRTGALFDDRNSALVDDLLASHPELMSLEMETFQLFDLARCVRPHEPLRAAAFCIALAERYSGRFLETRVMRERELQGGAAALDALVAMPLMADASTFNGASGFVAPPHGYVWGEEEAGAGTAAAARGAAAAA